MLEALPENTRKVLLEYDFIKRYLNGMLAKDKFLEWLKEHAQELLSKGVPKDYINTLWKADAEDEFHRKAAYSKFARFCRKIGLDVATPEDKVRWIKSVNANNLLDITSIGAGLLRGFFGFQRWRKDSKATHSIVGGMGDVVEIDPPDDSHKQFKEFFNRMRRRISVGTKDKWAVKLYFALICAHMFPDGNGRIARNAYFLLRANGLLDEQKVIKRSGSIGRIAGILNNSALVDLMRKEGLPVSDFNKATEYQADEEIIQFSKGNSECLKYLACKRVLQKRGQWNVEIKEIVYGSWDKIMRAEFEEEYQKIRVLWYWTAISLADKYYKYFQQELDKAML